MRFLGRPESLRGKRGVGPEFLRLVSVSLDRFPQAWGSLEQARRLGGAQESLRDAPGAPGKLQEQLRNEQIEFEENRGLELEAQGLAPASGLRARSSKRGGGERKEMKDEEE